MKIWHTPEERRSFMEQQGLLYLDKAEVLDFPSFRKDLSLSPYYRENKQEFDQLWADYGSLLEAGHMADVSIRPAGEGVGYGLFAESELAPGALIGEYTGVVGPGLDVRDIPGKTGGYETDYTWDYPDAWYEDILLEINALKKGNELRYVNHSFEPNLAVEHTKQDNRWVIFFVAEHLIPPGTQLTVDYGEEYWSGGFRELILF